MPTVYGVQLEDIPDGANAIEVLVAVKALDENGVMCIYRRGSDGLTPWETVGILQMLLDRARNHAQDCYIDGEDEDEIEFEADDA